MFAFTLACPLLSGRRSSQIKAYPTFSAIIILGNCPIKVRHLFFIFCARYEWQVPVLHSHIRQVAFFVRFLAMVRENRTVYGEACLVSV